MSKSEAEGVLTKSQYLMTYWWECVGFSDSADSNTSFTVRQRACVISVSPVTWPMLHAIVISWQKLGLICWESDAKTFKTTKKKKIFVLKSSIWETTSDFSAVTDQLPTWWHRLVSEGATVSFCSLITVFVEFRGLNEAQKSPSRWLLFIKTMFKFGPSPRCCLTLF